MLTMESAEAAEAAKPAEAADARREERQQKQMRKKNKVLQTIQKEKDLIEYQAERLRKLQKKLRKIDGPGCAQAWWDLDRMQYLLRQCSRP